MTPFCAQTRRLAATFLLSVVMVHGVLELATLARVPAALETFASWATRSAPSRENKVPAEAPGGLCGLTPAQRTEELAQAAPQPATCCAPPARTVAASCCSPSVPAAKRCSCSSREGGCPMKGQCTCGTATQGRAQAGLFFTLPGCHPMDGSPQQAALGELLTLRLAFLLPETSPFPEAWILVGRLNHQAVNLLPQSYPPGTPPPRTA